jgi:energy-coupling factor transporter ATP-binding protein EcfA2
MDEVIKFSNYSFRYPRGTRPALKDLNLVVRSGERVGIVGPTGSGKTTLVQSLLGLPLRTTGGTMDGELFVDGLNVRECDTAVLAQHAGLVLDDPVKQIFCLTVREDVSFGPSNLGLARSEIQDRVERVLKLTGLDTMESRDTTRLSGGESQTVAIAGVIAMQPKVVVLDEATAMLDPAGKQQVLSVISQLAQEHDLTVLITESGLDLDYVVGVVDRIIVLDSGQVVVDKLVREALLDNSFSAAGLERPQVTELFVRSGGRVPRSQIPISIDEAVKSLSLAVPKLSADTSLRRIERSSSTNLAHGIVHVKNLHHIFYPNIRALNGISFEVQPESICGIIGQNGSGKTTLSMHLVGLLKPTNKDANVIVDNLDVSHAPTSEVVKHVNYVFQNPDSQLFCNTVKDELGYGLKLMKVSEDEVLDRVKGLMRDFELSEFEDESPLYLPKHLKKRVALASIMVMDPKVLIIDEPTTGLDSTETRKLMELIVSFKKLGRTILIISHDMETIAKYCDNVIVMAQGTILTQGSPRTVFSNPGLLHKADLLPPEITRFGQAVGISDVMTVDEMIKILNWE